MVYKRNKSTIEKIKTRYRVNMASITTLHKVGDKQSTEWRDMVIKKPSQL